MHVWRYQSSEQHMEQLWRHMLRLIDLMLPMYSICGAYAPVEEK